MSEAVSSMELLKANEKSPFWQRPAPYVPVTEAGIFSAASGVYV